MNVLMERNYEGLAFTYVADFIKADEKDGKKYVVVRASDTNLDRDNERVSIDLINKMKALAKQGKLELLESHRATFPLGYSVDVIENPDDPYAFYPVFELDERQPLSQYLFERIKEGTANFGVSIGGKNPKVRWVMEKDGSVITEVVDAEIDHVAFTRRGYEANPNTGIVRAIIKSLQSVGLWEKEMNILEQVTRVAVEEKPEKPDEKDNEIEAGKHYTVSDERIRQIAEAVVKASPLSADRVIDDDEFAREMFHALSEAKIRSQKDALVFQREKVFGYERGVYACAEPPAVWKTVNPTQFADLVGFLYPMDKSRFMASYRHFLKIGVNELYLPESAIAVLTNFVKEALTQGYQIFYWDNPVLMSMLPAEVKTQLSDYNPQADAMLKEVAQIWIEQTYADSLDSVEKESDRDELKEALRERERKYGYIAPLNANLTKPSRWENVPEDQFADPVGYKYPVHTPKNARAALTYFNKPYNRQFYTVDGQIKVLENILKACLRYGIKVAFQPDDPLYWLIDKSLKKKLEGYDEHEDMDTEAYRAEMRKKAEKVSAEKEAQAYLLVKTSQGYRIMEISAITSGTAAEIVDSAKDADTDDVKLRALPTEAPTDHLTEPKPIKPEDIRFVVTLPLKAYPLSIKEVVDYIAELASKYGAGAVDFNVIRIDGGSGMVSVGKEGEIRFKVNKTAKTVEVHADMRTPALLHYAITEKAKQLLGTDKVWVDAVNRDKVVIGVGDPDNPTFYAFKWHNEGGEIMLSDKKVEVVYTYVPAELGINTVALLDERFNE